MRYARIIGAAAVSLILALGASVLGGLLPLIVSVVMAVVIAVGWPAATGIKARRRHNVIIAAAGVIACSLVNFVPDQQLIWLPAVVGVAFMVVCVAELVRGEGAEGRLESTLASVTGVLAAVSASGWIGLSHVEELYGLGTWVTVTGVGLPLALIIGVVGVRIISAAPETPKRRGLLTLGVTPVALLGVAALFAGRILASVVA